MNTMKNLSRRDFLRFSGMGAAALLTGGVSQLLGANASPAVLAAGATPSVANTFTPDVEVALRAAPSEVSIFPGRATRVWTYQGAVLRGDPASLRPLDGAYLGPVIRVRQGQKVRVHFTNELPEQSIIH